jgi:ethanolamine transporter EutH
MISILITILIYLLVLGVIWWIVTLIPLPHPFGQIARVVVVVIGLLLILNLLLGFVDTPGLRPIR